MIYLPWLVLGVWWLAIKEALTGEEEDVQAVEVDYIPASTYLQELSFEIECDFLAPEKLCFIANTAVKIADKKQSCTYNQLQYNHETKTFSKTKKVNQ